MDGRPFSRMNHTSHCAVDQDQIDFEWSSHSLDLISCHLTKRMMSLRAIQNPKIVAAMRMVNPSHPRTGTRTAKQRPLKRRSKRHLTDRSRIWPIDARSSQEKRSSKHHRMSCRMISETGMTRWRSRDHNRSTAMEECQAVETVRSTKKSHRYERIIMFKGH